MKNKKIILSIALSLVVFSSFFTMFVPTAKASAYTGHDSALVCRSVVPIDVISFSSLGVENQVLLTSTNFLKPTTDDEFINISTIDTINNSPNIGDLNVKSSLYYYNKPIFPVDNYDCDIVQNFLIYGVNNSYRNLSFGLTSHDFIYWRSQPYVDSNIYLIPHFACTYTLMLEWVYPNGEIGTYSNNGSIVNEGSLDITNLLHEGISTTILDSYNNEISVDFVYIKSFRIFLTKSGISPFTQLSLDLYSDVYYTGSSSVDIGKQFIDEVLSTSGTRVIYEVDWFESIVDSIDSLLSIEILPEISFYDILIVCVCIPLLVAILKAWLGG